MRRKITKRKLGEIREDRSDWARVDTMTGRNLERAIAADPDADVSNLDWTKARLVLPQRKESIHLRVDPEVLSWFRNKGRGHLTRMNAVLRAYVEAHQKNHPRR
ncbi:MAG: hypothetical protein A3F68_11785 [Acidobacteria bacterium RIFCSPLOWO2_12_FULL_54_10]|nr:MAG: hypothetical protein A3F68_11785 [Acidobacteria bacterium RIFCSPLOWO2_12_FULL_54_10]